MKRIEDPRLLTGKGKYIDDIELTNMAHAAVLGSPHAHARVKSIDVSKAEALPGVILVFTAKDAAEQTAQVASFSSPPVPQYCMAIDKIRHVGEVVAAVVAEELADGRRAGASDIRGLPTRVGGAPSGSRRRASTRVAHGARVC